MAGLNFSKRLLALTYRESGSGGRWGIRLRLDWAEAEAACSADHVAAAPGADELRHGLCSGPDQNIGLRTVDFQDCLLLQVLSKCLVTGGHW